MLRISKVDSRILTSLISISGGADKHHAQDAGTYLYNAAAPWDNPLVTTRVHNTVTSRWPRPNSTTRAGRFLVLDWANAFSKNIVEADENILGRARAYHRGYRNIKHERTVTVYKTNAGSWKINLLHAAKLCAPIACTGFYPYRMEDRESKIGNRSSSKLPTRLDNTLTLFCILHSSFLILPRPRR